MNTTTPFRPEELSSRKLWQLVTARPSSEIDDTQLQQAIDELAARRHDLTRLQRDQLDNGIHNV